RGHPILPRSDIHPVETDNSLLGVLDNIPAISINPWANTGSNDAGTADLLAGQGLGTPELRLDHIFHVHGRSELSSRTQAVLQRLGELQVLRVYWPDARIRRRPGPVPRSLRPGSAEVNLAAAIHERLSALEPQSIDLLDESGKHAGHAGANAGGSHFRTGMAGVLPGFVEKVYRLRL